MWTQEPGTEIWTQELLADGSVNTRTTGGQRCEHELLADRGVNTGTTDTDVDTITTDTREQPVTNLFCATVTLISNDPCCHKVHLKACFTRNACRSKLTKR